MRCPASVDAATAARIEAIALAAFRATGCRDYARVDLRSNSAGDMFVLEVNANPDAGPSAGLRERWPLPDISYDDFAVQLVETAAVRPRHRCRLEGPTSNGPHRQIGDLKPIGFQEVRRTGAGSLRAIR